MATPKPECIDALLEAATRLGKSPTKAQYEDLGLTPASATIIRQMGGWNAAKDAAGLGTNASRGSRVAPKPGDVELPDDLTWENLTVDQRWHYRNVEWNKKRTLRRRANLRRWVNDEKRDRRCKQCGSDSPGCLDFHHQKESEKKMDVGTMITYGYGRDSLRTEIEKCVVLCANCHRKMHYTPPSKALRKWVYGIKDARGGCRRCEEDHLACLDFHHETDPKVDTIARMLANGRPREEIREEISKCIVLCANCHRLLHHDPPREPEQGNGPLEHDNHK